MTDSFPTRRAYDLLVDGDNISIDFVANSNHQQLYIYIFSCGSDCSVSFVEELTLQQNLECISTRSEEHTSELQSLMRISYAVFCLTKIIFMFHHQHSQLKINHEISNTTLYL